LVAHPLQSLFCVHGFREQTFETGFDRSELAQEVLFVFLGTIEDRVDVLLLQRAAIVLEKFVVASLCAEHAGERLKARLLCRCLDADQRYEERGE